MRLGWGRDERSIFLLVPRTQRSTSAASRGPLYFAWGCFRDFLSKPCVHRRRGAMPGPGHEIVGASRLQGRIDPTPTRHTLAAPPPPPPAGGASAPPPPPPTR